MGVISHDQAYDIQHQMVTARLAGAVPVGFKAGLTSLAAQQRFSVSEPVAGVLMPGGRVDSPVKLSGFKHPMMELELGFVMASPITAPVRDVSALSALVAAVFPVIELPDLAFADIGSLSGIDIVASNVASHSWLQGDARSPALFDLNAIPVTLSRNDVLLLSSRSDDVMGSQWLALQWLINRTLANGWTLEAGQLLITGAIGRMLPAEPGTYRADFGPLGSVVYEMQVGSLDLKQP